MALVAMTHRGEADLVPRRYSAAELSPAFLAFYLDLLKRVGSFDALRAGIGFVRKPRRIAPSAPDRNRPRVRYVVRSFVKP